MRLWIHDVSRSVKAVKPLHQNEYRSRMMPVEPIARKGTCSSSSHALSRWYRLSLLHTPSPLLSHAHIQPPCCAQMRPPYCAHTPALAHPVLQPPWRAKTVHVLLLRNRLLIIKSRSHAAAMTRISGRCIPEGVKPATHLCQKL